MRNTITIFTNLLRINLCLVFLFSCSSAPSSRDVFLIELTTLSGESTNLQEQATGNAAIVIFYSPECPMCEKYTLTINQLIDKDLDENTKLFAVFPGPFFEKDEILFFKHRYGFEAEILLDRENKLAKALSARVTPEVFFFGKDKKLIYTGAIDNWMPELGRIRTSINAHYLKDAINAYEAGERPEVFRTEAVGCLIEYL